MADKKPVPPALTLKSPGVWVNDCGSTFGYVQDGYVCPLEKRTKTLNEAAGSDETSHRARNNDDRNGPKFV